MSITTALYAAPIRGQYAIGFTAHFYFRPGRAPPILLHSSVEHATSKNGIDRGIWSKTGTMP